MEKQQQEISKSPSFLKEEFEKYLQENEDFFTSDVHKYAFGVGVFVRFLTDWQKFQLGGNQPFINRLHNFRLNKEKLQRVFTEAQNKLFQYNKNKDVHVELKRFIVEAGVQSGKAKLSDAELSFCFATGFESGYKFKQKK